MKKVFVAVLVVMFLTPGLIFADSLAGGSSGAGPLSTGGMNSSAMETSPSGGGGQRGVYPFVKIIASQIQPVSSIAPRGAVVPFTTFDVLSNVPAFPVEITIERRGISTDAAFQEVMLIANASSGISDLNAGRIVAYGTLNPATHRVTLYPFNLGYMTAARFTVAAMVSRNNSLIAGQVAKFAVVGAKFVVQNRGTMPATITPPVLGSSQSIIESLTLGTLLMWKNADGVILQAGSAEDLVIQKISLMQTGGSVSVNDVSYPCVSSRYLEPYQDICNFDPPLVLSKGNHIVMVPRSHRVFMPNAHNIVARGALYGYQILPVVSPFVIETGTLQLSASRAFPAQNIVVNVPNQPLAGFTMNVKNEAVSVGTMKFLVTLGDHAPTVGPEDITNVTMVDENGIVVAGPVDVAPNGIVTFWNPITFPIGSHFYLIRGKIQPTVNQEMTLYFSITPSTDFTSVRGVASGVTILPAPDTRFIFSRMTVKVGALTVSVSSIPIAQSVVAGMNQFTFATYILDATASAEDIRLTGLPLELTVPIGNATDISNCKLYDGATVLNNGSYVVNPTQAGPAVAFTFDQSALVNRGTSKTFTLKCDVSSSARGSYAWGLDANQSVNFTGATGATTGQTTAEVFTGSQGQFMTGVAGGTFTVNLDINSPSYQIVAAGSTNVELARLKFSASNEDIDVRQVALQLSDTALNTPNDLVGRSVSLWDAQTGNQVGTAVFALGDTAVSSLFQPGVFQIRRNEIRVLIAKGDISVISPAGPLTASGDLFKVDFDGDNPGLNGTYGVGVSSGNVISPSGSDTASAGVRIVRAYPRLAYIPLTSNERQLTPGTTADKTLYKFSVTAVGGDVALYKFTFPITVSGAAVNDFRLITYPDPSFSSHDGVLVGFSVGGGPGTLEVTTGGIYTLAAGQTKYFRFSATVSNVQSGASVMMRLAGDAAAPSGSFMSTIAGIDNDLNNDFIWSPVSNGTAVTLTDPDFTNGNSLPGLPTSNMTPETLTSPN